tara:strand:+ start:402 stop:992 length:591 start_codon:yes stop_codon:yes gene_type:complete
MTVGLFFGSFNPIHNGHIEMAKEILNQKKFAEIWFVITPLNPTKNSSALAPYIQRVKMVELAIKNHNNLFAETIEAKLPKPNYTFNTIDILTKLHPKKSFSLIIGADNFQNFKNWKNWEKILSQVNVLVYPRDQAQTLPNQILLDRSRIEIIKAPLFKNRSTLIRESISNNKFDTIDDIPKEVKMYIKSKGIYHSN